MMSDLSNERYVIKMYTNEGWGYYGSRQRVTDLNGAKILHLPNALAIAKLLDELLGSDGLTFIKKVSDNE